jgi:hypothetical protein
MARRAVPAGLVVAAAFADGSGSASIAFYAFLALVVVTAVIALNSYGELVEAPMSEGQDETTRRLQALLWAVLLGFAVLGAAARAPALGEGAIPHVGSKVVIVCLLVLCTEGIVELVAMSRRRPARSARPRSGPVQGVRGNREVPPATQNVSEETASLARSING